MRYFIEATSTPEDPMTSSALPLAPSSLFMTPDEWSAVMQQLSEAIINGLGDARFNFGPIAMIFARRIEDVAIGVPPQIVWDAVPDSLRPSANPRMVVTQARRGFLPNALVRFDRGGYDGLVITFGKADDRMLVFWRDSQGNVNYNVALTES